MLRSSLSCVKNIIPRIEKNYHGKVLGHIQRFHRFYGKGPQSFRAGPTGLSSTPTGRVVGRCALVVIGTCVGIKVWLATSDCQEALTDPSPTQPDPPPTERMGKRGHTLEEAISRSKDILQMIKDETSSPGIAVAVSVDGKHIWSQGLGYSDVENRVPCTPDTVMRIASISKAVNTAIVGKLMEEGLLDIDKPVQAYVPKFPEKTFLGEKGKKDGDDGKSSDKSSEKKTYSGDKPGTPEMELSEMHIKEHFNTVDESIGLFKDDQLVHKPGTKFLYSTHGYTLVSAVLEGASKKSFESLLLELFKDLGLRHTYLDENSPLIYNRSRYYIKTKTGRLVNAPYVDCSYKWAGGGLLSTVGDVIKFGNVMLYSYQFKSPNQGTVIQSTQPKQNPISQSESREQSLTKTDTRKEVTEKSKAAKEAKNKDISEKDELNQNKLLSGYLKRETMDKLWHIDDFGRSSWDNDAGYGLGWTVVPDKKEYGCCRHQPFYVSHSGAAIGASSILLIVPHSKGDNPPSGIVVAIITNMISVSLVKTALKIAQEFENVEQTHEN